MTRHTAVAATVGALAIAAGTLIGVAPPASATTATAAQVGWAACPSYSDEVLAGLGLPPERFADFRALFTRTECGTVQVPLDYRNPGGSKIAIAITRLRAADQKNKLGSIAVNPGGPGGSGYLMPHQLAMQSPAGLNDRYDLIGFDPRGVGYSTKVNCTPPADTPRPEIPPGPLTEATAKKLYEVQVAVNQACWSSNPAFLSQLTTANVARDLDQVRRALGLSQVSYFGVSWGTLMGAVYRSMFPQTIARMWLDSVVGPQGNRFDVRVHDSIAAQEQQAARLSAWIAARTETYGLGTTTAEVLANVTKLKAQLDAGPITFSDVPDAVLDGRFIAFLATAPSPMWADAGTALQAMSTAKNGEPAPAAIKPIITPPDEDPSAPRPADAPERNNQIANTAILCNDDTGPHDFDTVWNNYQRWVKQFPITGGNGMPVEKCAGWPVPGKPFELRKSSGSLVMSGHRYESSTPYPWVHQMRAAIGGTVFTVDDDIHGSVAREENCATHLEAYFLTGNPAGAGCPGVTSSEAPVAALSTDDAGTRPDWHWRNR